MLLLLVVILVLFMLSLFMALVLLLMLGVGGCQCLYQYVVVVCGGESTNFFSEEGAIQNAAIIQNSVTFCYTIPAILNIWPNT